MEKETRNAIPKDPTVLRRSYCCANDLHKDTTIVNIAQLTKLSRFLTEQDSDRTLLKFKRKMLALLFDKQIVINDAQCLHYSRSKKRIIIKGDILFRQYYNNLG